MMNRREAIKQVTAMLGGVVFVGSGDLLTAVEHAHARVTASRKQIGTFTAQDVALLDEVADTSDLPTRSTVSPNCPARSRSMFTSSVG